MCILLNSNIDQFHEFIFAQSEHEKLIFSKLFKSDSNIITGAT